MKPFSMRAAPMFLITVMLVMFMMTMMNSVLHHTCEIMELRKHVTSAAIAPFGPFLIEQAEVQLAVVIPYPALNRSTVVGSMHRIFAVGNPCSLDNGEMSTRDNVRLVLLSNAYIEPADHLLLEATKKILGPYTSCFLSISVASSLLTEEEDIYPAGPSNMFFKTFLDSEVRGALSNASHMFWMEHDVYPLRTGWLDALVLEASKGDFWVSGSVYLGDGLDSAAAVSHNWDWVGHINGNALYDMQDSVFTEFLRLVIQYEPPNHFWKPFDVSIWRVLHAFPYTWPFYQKYRSKFVYSDFIHHWGFHVTADDVAHSTSLPNVFLVHGANFSAGNVLLRPKPVPANVVWTDRVQKSARLSILLRATAAEINSVHNAAVHTLAYAPDAHELVLVVPAADAPAFTLRFNATGTAHVAIRTEPPPLSDGPSADELQHARTILHGDEFCSGDLILHIGSHQTLKRSLELRDILWLNRPILVHRRNGPPVAGAPSPAPVAIDRPYANGPDEHWAAGTAHALGAPAAAEHDFRTHHLRVYPRALYRRARGRIEATHGVGVTEFLASAAASGAAEAARRISAHNVLGAYALLFAPELVSAVPVEPEAQRALTLPPPVLRPPFY